jgi:hypothetical protein
MTHFNRPPSGGFFIGFFRSRDALTAIPQFLLTLHTQARSLGQAVGENRQWK